MGLFQLKDANIIIPPDNLFIPPFQDIWKRDKSKNKDTAFKELAYVFYLEDYLSPYAAYPRDKRESTIIEQIIKDSKWKPDGLILEACKQYKEFQETPEMRLLKAWENKIDELAVFLDESEFTDDNVEDIVKAGLNMQKIVQATQALREVVRKQVTEKATVRGNKSISLFEE